ncbi:hypothetical protein BJX62DRAFT_156837 [Aspergillus germanicus]
MTKRRRKKKLTIKSKLEERLNRNRLHVYDQKLEVTLLIGYTARLGAFLPNCDRGPSQFKSSRSERKKEANCDCHGKVALHVSILDCRPDLIMNMLRIKWMLIRRDAVAVIDLFTPSSSTPCLLSVLGSWKMKSGEREERGHLSKKEFVLSSEFTRWGGTGASALVVLGEYQT